MDFDKMESFRAKKTESDRQERKTSQYELQEMLYKAKPYRIVLDVTESERYTHPSAWAHTIPEEKSICIRPREKIPYWLLTFQEILGHEVGHNLYHMLGLPDNNEDVHTNNAYQNRKNPSVELRSNYVL